jgi:predicted Zn-dependent protease
MHTRQAVGAIAICLWVVLSACDSSEERAEKHFQTALAFVEAGDPDRAIVEFRNVFKLDGRHKEARQAYAALQRDRGFLKEAYGQYLRLVEQYPDDLDGLIALVEMALETGNLEELERHGAAVVQLAGSDPRVQAISATLAYQNALEARDIAALDAARKTAEALVEAHPELIMARRTVIKDMLRENDWTGVLQQIDAGLAIDPEARDLYTLRLGALYQLDDKAGIEAQLTDLVARFPDDPNMHQALVRWYVDQDNLDAAEAHLRSMIDPAAETSDSKVVLIQFLTEMRGADAARAELDQMIGQGGPEVPLLRGIRAGLDFDSGNKETAIAEMEALLQGADVSQQSRNLKLALAQMLLQTGNPVGARARVEEVLVENATEVGALKLKAAWLIEDDKTGDAIASLRTGLGAAPRDPELMTLMARAHERDGNRELMGEMLALAADAAGYSPQEALRYATFLAQDGRLLPAEDAVLAALRQRPQNPALLAALGDIYLRLQDWPRAEQVIGALETLDTPEARDTANELTAQQLAGQNRSEELLAFLEELKRETGATGGISVDAAIVQSHITRGNVTAALAHVDTALTADPDNADLQFLRAAVLVTDGHLAPAETVYRDLLARDPTAERIWTALFELTLRKGDPAGAGAVLDEAIAALPDSAPLKLRKAGELERSGDLDGAIAIYEDLYAGNSNSQLLANNLASLLASHRSDAASLARAELIARRLRGTDVPAFQDTYGWIAYRLGNHDEAMRYLEPAAQSLAEDALVQFHLAATYAALGRNAQALTQFQRVKQLADSANPPAFMAEVTAELARLEAAN